MSAAELGRRLERLRRDHLPELVEAIHSVAVQTSPDGSSLVPMLDYHFDTGGKRLRGMLPLLVTEILGGEPARAVPFGAACEMLHNATLVHDDLQDQDTHRRGRPTVWKQFGEPQAINLGDAMFYYTLMLIRRIEGSAELRESLYERAMLDTLAVIDGQEREFALKSKPTPTLADYFTMVDGKTSALMALSLSGGAMLVGAGAGTIERIRDMAHHLGILFQIQDDVLDLYGDKGRGRVGEDVAEGKRSLLVVHAMSELEADARSRLVDIIDRPRDRTTDDDIAEVMRLFAEAGSLDHALAEIDRRRHAAIESASRTGNRNLVRLAQYLADLFLDPIADVRQSRARPAVERDSAFLGRMLPEVSRTFALSIESLPDPLRSAIRTAYLLCRIVDTIEDAPYVSAARRAELFAAFEAAFTDAESAAALAAADEWQREEPDAELCRGAAKVFAAYADLEPDLRDAVRGPILEMARGMSEYAARADRDGAIRIRDLEDLDRYCYFVAGTVGKMLTAVFAWYVEADDSTRAFAESRAIQFGQGLQLVNVLKDIASDLERGVCFLPEDGLRSRGLDRNRLLDPALRERALDLVREIGSRARSHLDRAVEYTLVWPADRSHAVRFFCAVPLGLAIATLRRVVDGDDTLVAGREPKVARARVLWIYERAQAAAADDRRLSELFAELAGDMEARGPAAQPARRLA